ncbi:MAG: helix-turn-helix domain-containing protein [Bacteroidales bacterium]|nr:helix-turn-helix domain-containing protein [Bacteroidales bacterium]
MEARIRESVEAWVEQKGYLKPVPGVDEIAGIIGVPRDQLTAFVRTHKKKTLLSWRKELRVEEAKRLLIDSPDLPISTIGEIVGIQDKSNFRKQFTETVGMSPREFRERNMARNGKRLRN